MPRSPVINIVIIIIIIIVIIIIIISSGKNTSTKVSEKLFKHKDLEVEITRTWQIKTEMVQVVVGALAVIKKGPKKLVREIQETSTSSLQIQ